MKCSRSGFLTAALLLVAASAAAQISGERPVSSPQYGAAPGDQWNAVAASDGTDFLVAWADGRGGVGGVTSIYMSRVSRTGEILDGTGTRVPTEQGPWRPYPLGLFHIDGAYTLLYEYSNFSGFNIATVTIGDDGRLLDRPRVILTGSQRRTIAASNGSRVVLFSSDGSARNNDITVLNARGDVVDRYVSPGMPAASSGIGSNGSGFLLVTYASDGVNLIALDASGHFTKMTRVALAVGGTPPFVASDGHDYLVLYDGSGKVITQSVTADSEILATSTVTGARFLRQSALRWTGRNYLLSTPAAGTAPQLSLFQLDRAGLLAGAPQSIASDWPGIDTSAIAWNGREALLIWAAGFQNSLNAGEVQGALLDADGAPRSPVLTIPTSSTPQARPAIATGGAYELVAWTEPTGIYATRITQDGVPLDGRGTLVSAQTIDSISLPNLPPIRVAFDGTAYLVAWGGYRGVTGQRVDARTGARVGGPIPLATCATSFDIAGDGTSAVIFAAECSDSHSYAQRIGVAGAEGFAVSISPKEMLTKSPRAAWNGQEWLVAWEKLIQVSSQIPGIFYRSNLYAARLSGTLTLLDVQPISIAVTDFSEGGSVLASNGKDFLVAWSGTFSKGASGLIYRRIGSDGSLGESSPFAKGPSEADSLAWSGSRFTLVYESERDYWQHDLFLTHIAASAGDLPDVDPSPVSVTEFDERSASLVALPNGRVRVLYTRVAPEPRYGGVARVFFRDDLRDAAPAPRRRSVSGR